MKEAVCIWPLGAQLAEGPCWHAADAVLWFVDIEGRFIHRFDPASGSGRSWTAPDQVSFALPRDDGHIVAGLPGRLARFSPTTGAFETLAVLEQDRPRNRTNDACIDCNGRLWFGSMDDHEVEASGALYCWDGRTAPVALDHGYLISNGPAFSSDSRTFYHTDTARRLIYKFDVASDGTISDRKRFIEIEEEAGWPDGTTVDAEGCLWIALYGGWAVRRYSPHGELLQVVSLPCAQVTKLALGGSDLKTAFVTTARKGLSPAELAVQPFAGGLFAFSADVPGIAVPPLHSTPTPHFGAPGSTSLS